MIKIFSVWGSIGNNIKARLAIFWSLLSIKTCEDPWEFRQQLDVLRQGGSLEPDPGIVGDQEYLQKCIIKHFGTFKNLRGLGAGCGTGRIEAWLASKGAEMLCMDHLIEALQISRIHAQRSHCTEHYVVGDLERMPFKANTFDFIYSGGVLEHFHNPTKALREYFRVTKPNGVIIVSVPNLVGINALFGIKPLVELIRKGNGNSPVENDFSERRFRKVIEDSGFRCLNISPTFFNTFNCFPFYYLRRALSLIGIYRLYCKLLDAFGRRFPAIAFGYSFMIALAQRPKC